MPFKKGQVANPNGRAGSSDANKRRRESINKLIDTVLDDPKTLTAFNRMSAAKKWDIIVKLLPYSIARLESEAPGSDVPVVSTAEAAAQLTLVKKKTGT